MPKKFHTLEKDGSFYLVEYERSEKVPRTCFNCRKRFRKGEKVWLKKRNGRIMPKAYCLSCKEGLSV